MDEIVEETWCGIFYCAHKDGYAIDVQLFACINQCDLCCSRYPKHLISFSSLSSWYCSKHCHTPGRQRLKAWVLYFRLGLPKTHYTPGKEINVDEERSSEKWIYTRKWWAWQQNISLMNCEVLTRKHAYSPSTTAQKIHYSPGNHRASHFWNVQFPGQTSC